MMRTGFLFLQRLIPAFTTFADIWYGKSGVSADDYRISLRFNRCQRVGG